MVYLINYEKLTAKKLVDKYGLLPKVFIKNLNGWFRVELTYKSKTIEGNTLGRGETGMKLPRGRLTVPLIYT